MVLAQDVADTLTADVTGELLGGPSAVVPDHVPDVSAQTHMPTAGVGDIVVLTGEGEIPAIMVNALADVFGAITVIQEQKQATSVMVKRRFKMLGPVQATGQVGFGFLLKLLHKRSAARKEEILTEAGMSADLPGSSTIHHVASVNDDACRELLRNENPRVVVLVGTRMVRAATLKSVEAPFINYHAGLNPSYRGMNGGYWALANDDPSGAGITVHLVDEGVDTGEALYWRRFTPAPTDNFVTYPLLQAAVARDLLIGAVADVMNGRLAPKKVPLASAQWFHPTLWGYLSTGLRKSVW